MKKKKLRKTSTNLKVGPEQSGVIISSRTIGHTLNQAELYERSSKKITAQKKTHKKETTDNCQKLSGQRTINLENILWTDETNIELSGNVHQQYVYRRQNEAYN